MHLISHFQKRPLSKVQEELIEDNTLLNTYLEQDVIPNLTHSDEIFYEGDGDYLDDRWFPLNPKFTHSLGYILLGVIGTGCYSTCYLSKKGNDYCVVVISNAKFSADTLRVVKSKQHLMSCTCTILDIVTYEGSIAIYDKDYNYYNHEDEGYRPIPSSIQELDGESGEYVIIVEELLTPLNYYLQSVVVDDSEVAKSILSIYEELHSQDMNYTDSKIDNLAITIEGGIKFIDLESISRGKGYNAESDVKWIMANIHKLKGTFDYMK